MPADSLVADLTSPLSNVRSSIRTRTSIPRSGLAVARRHPRLPLLHRARPFRRMSHAVLAKDVRPAIASAIVKFMDRYDNTVQYAGSWTSRRPSSASPAIASPCRCRSPLRRRREDLRPEGLGESRFRDKTKLEKIFLTNEFDDPLEGFDSSVYVPCLRTDTLVFSLDKPETRRRLATPPVEVRDAATLRWQALPALHPPGREGAPSPCRRPFTPRAA